MATAEQVLAQARRLVGEDEAKLGSNNTTVNRAYPVIAGKAYCMGYIKWAMEQAGCRFLDGCSQPYSVPAVRKYLEAKGCKMSGPKVGGVFIEGDDMHGGFISMVGSGWFIALEGNGGHVRSTQGAAVNYTGSTYEGIGYRRIDVTSNVRFYYPPYDSGTSSGGSSSGGSSKPAPAPEPEKTAEDWGKELQSWLGVTADGVIGPDTRAAAQDKLLRLMVAKYGLKSGDKDKDGKGLVYLLQGLLNMCGAGPLKMDGSYGPATEAAVRKYQRAAGKTVDGKAGQQVWTATLGL